MRFCPLWVNLRHPATLPKSSASGCQADENDAKADVPAQMSAVGGGAGVACQGLSGPFLATSGIEHPKPLVGHGPAY